MKVFFFLVVNFSVHLNRLVFVMTYLLYTVNLVNYVVYAGKIRFIASRNGYTSSVPSFEVGTASL